MGDIVIPNQGIDTIVDNTTKTNLSTTPYVLPSGRYYLFAYNGGASTFNVYVEAYINGAWRKVVTLSLGSLAYGELGIVLSDGQNLRIEADDDSIVIHIYKLRLSKSGADVVVPDIISSNEDIDSVEQLSLNTSPYTLSIKGELLITYYNNDPINSYILYLQYFDGASWVTIKQKTISASEEGVFDRIYCDGSGELRLYASGDAVKVRIFRWWFV